MTTAAIAELPVKEMAGDDSVLFLWSTSPVLPDPLRVVETWGFEYKTSFVWDKVGHNYGNYNSTRHELLLEATRGSCLPDNAKLYDSVVSIEKPPAHSSKPGYFRKMIDDLYTWGPRVELFARGSVPGGWDAWANEAEGAA